MILKGAVKMQQRNASSGKDCSMKAEIHIIDDNGERVASKPTLIEPVDIQDNGFVTAYRFEFEFVKLDEDVSTFDQILEVQK